MIDYTVNIPPRPWWKVRPLGNYEPDALYSVAVALARYEGLVPKLWPWERVPDAWRVTYHRSMFHGAAVDLPHIGEDGLTRFRIQLGSCRYNPAVLFPNKAFPPEHTELRNICFGVGVLDTNRHQAMEFRPRGWRDWRRWVAVLISEGPGTDLDIGVPVPKWEEEPT